MNILAKVKLSNTYDLVLNNLTHESGTEPITDIDGTTALLLDDGTSWEYLDGEWHQIDIEADKIILNSVYPFITSVCNSIKENFSKSQLSAIYQDAKMEKDDDNSIIITDLSEVPKVISGDYVILKTYIRKYAVGDTVCWQHDWSKLVEKYFDLYGITLPDYPIEELNSYLSTVVEASDTSITLDGNGLDVRITGNEEIVGVFFVSFPQDFIDAALGMLGYDIFQREDKEKRQERLGNYTYTNFEPVQYYGNKYYPSKYTNVISYYGEHSL